MSDLPPRFVAQVIFNQASSSMAHYDEASATAAAGQAGGGAGSGPLAGTAHPQQQAQAPSASGGARRANDGFKIWAFKQIVVELGPLDFSAEQASRAARCSISAAAAGRALAPQTPSLQAPRSHLRRV
jgi:hypothetical protein